MKMNKQTLKVYKKELKEMRKKQKQLHRKQYNNKLKLELLDNYADRLSRWLMREEDNLKCGK